MNHVYQYNGYYFSAKNKKEALEYYEEEDDAYNVPEKDFEKQNNELVLDIMLTEKDNKEFANGDLNIPENSTKKYLGEDGFDDYTWMVSARNIDWAKINSGLLCKEL